MREIIFYKSYFLDFYNSLSEKARRKINYSLHIVSNQVVVPTKFMKFLSNSGSIYEIRAKEGSNEYRLLCFFKDGDLISGGNIVVIGNCFAKKGTKDYKREIDKANKIRNEYFDGLDEDEEE